MCYSTYNRCRQTLWRFDYIAITARITIMTELLKQHTVIEAPIILCSVIYLAGELINKGR